MTSEASIGASLRRGLLLMALIVCGLGAASIRTMVVGAEAMDHADAAFDRGDIAESVRLARRAASLSVPGAEHVNRAYARLEVIARGAEAVGQEGLSIAAWDATRAAAVESRSPWSVERPELERANQNLARLRARNIAEKSPNTRTDQATRQLLQTLDESSRSKPTAALLPIGFVLSVLGLGWAALRGSPERGRWFSRDLAIGVAVAVIGVACWTLAVYTT
jgi:hypothetical protein